MYRVENFCSKKLLVIDLLMVISDDVFFFLRF